MIKYAIFIILPPLVFLFQSSPPTVAIDPANWFERYGWAILAILLTNGFQFFLNRKKTGSETNKLDAETIGSLILTIHKIQDTNDSLYGKVQYLRRIVLMIDEAVDLLIRVKIFLQGNADAKEIRRDVTEFIAAVTKVEKEDFHKTL